MQFQFHKMHGLGNDFVVIDARTSPVAMTQTRAAAIANRRTGIGCDQVIVLEPSASATLIMRIYNADGSEAQACGNATRCVALLIGEAATIETAGGTLSAEPGLKQTSVTMGMPAFDWEHIPLAMPMDTRRMPVAWDGLERPQAVNVGNPHVIFFVDDVDAVDLATVGPVIETDPLFPERINVNVASITGPNALRLRVWERGVGLTMACGTGACATAVTAIRDGLVASPVTVSLPGGDLTITWHAGEPIGMAGPATHVFSGHADWNALG